MTQAELAAKIAEDIGVSKATGAAMLKSLVGEITKKLKKGEEIRVAGLGTFRVAKRAARKARNPRTGEAIKLKASKQPKFSVSATLKNALNPTRGAAAGGKAESRTVAARTQATTRRASAKPTQKAGTRGAAAKRTTIKRR
jgi:DNA-binding protein HU-beta